MDRPVGQRKLRESDTRFRQFGEASSDVLWIRNADTLELEYLSPAFDHIYGMDHRSMLARPALESWIELILPEDRHMVHEAIGKVRNGQRALTEYRIWHPEGRVRWMRNTKFPLLDDDGKVVRIGGIGHDATEEKEAADRLQVLIAELQHRTRNLMAVVQAVSERTLRESATLAEFGPAYSDRLRAIARVHGLLSRLTDGDKVSFDELLMEELRAHGVNGERVLLDGPSGVRLRSTTLQTYALALHELATNATKYGALSTDSGRLAIRWRTASREDGTPVLQMEWREQFETPSERPADGVHSGGYGRELIERALPYQLKARTSYRLEPNGLLCTVEVPLPTD
ncbi:PAS domain-containing protein [Pseudoxanthomonas helianthi]|uniref:histidine kinase n=1 Tax=Pseudoxanthomonas helianthi TaxID=1453541 RepID=A0A940X285_9GAMM|nr:HWE histidine kinase domain-containing protein [Pseudoxanthomonas helianthi]MBP3983389.1 PAS domain-containing protein [Pseudoxanthomonas helianthi]